MAIIKPVILEGGQLKTAGVGDQVPQSFVAGLESSLETKASKTELSTGLGNKVDKVTGKGLSDTNYTQAEKNKLSGIATEATKNRADSLNADKEHTHTIVQVTGLDTALSGKASTTDQRFTDAREWTATTISQAEVEAGTETTRRAFTAQRVRQAIVAWWNSITGAFGRDLVTSANNTIARSKLGLGTSATKDIGTAAGNVMEVGAFGLGGTPLQYSTVDSLPSGTYFFLGSNSSELDPLGTKVQTLRIQGMSTNRFALLQIGTGNPQGSRASGIGYTPFNENGSGGFREIYHTNNTTKNPDGTIKASSPVINLYTDKHNLHNEGQFGATPTVVRKSKGVYEITGTLGLRSEGWYLDTPSDRNGNKYFNVEWSQNITPEAVDGIVDEYRDDIVVTIETFERVWNKDTGIFENGAPIDINDFQDRFVQLRFNEIKVEHEELMDDDTD